MGHSHEGMQVIRHQFNTSGVNSSGARLVTAEDKLWDCENARVDQRGALRKRDLYVEQGAGLIQQVRPDPGNYETVDPDLLLNTSDWHQIANSGDSLGIHISNDGLLTAHALGDADADGTVTYRREVLGGEYYNANALADGELSFGFDIQTNSMYPVPVLVDSQPGLYIDFGVENNKLFGIALADDVITVRTNTHNYLTVPGSTAFTSGAPMRLRFQLTNYGTYYKMSTYINDVLINGGLSVNNAGLLATSNQFVDVTVKNTAGLPADYLLSARITNFMLRDLAHNAFETPQVNEVDYRRFERTLSGAVENYRMAATNRAMWLDKNYDGMWRPFSKNSKDDVFFTDFRNSLITIAYDAEPITVVSRFDDTLTRHELDDAPNIRFAETHNNRLFGAGDSNHRLRLYYSADRDPNKWFAPDTDADGQETYDEVMSAGYFELDGKVGDEITCLRGDYMGNLIIATNCKLFRLLGSDISDWEIQEISGEIGALSPYCMQRVGSDLLILSDKGLATLQAVQGYGDLATKMLSHDIQNVFVPIGHAGSVLNLAKADMARLVYDHYEGEIIVALNGETWYYLRMDSGQWYGPVDQDYTCAAMGNNGFPEYPAILVGTEDGKILARTRRSSDDHTTTISSTVLNGRSVHPSLATMEKNWRNIRVLCNPTGKYDVTVRYKVEDKPWREVTRIMARKEAQVIGVDWEVNASEVESYDEPHIIDLQLNEKGKSLKYELITDAPEMSLLGVEIDFVPSGYEKGER